MDNINSFQDLLWSSSERLFGIVAEYIPNLVGAILLLIVGGLVASVMKFLMKKVLKWSHFSELVNKLKIPQTLKRVNITTHPDEVLGVITYWGVFLVFVTAAFEVLGMTVVVEALNEFIIYLPNIIIAAVIAVLTLMFAKWMRGLVEALFKDLSVDTTLVGTISEVAVIIFGGVIVLAQLGVDMTIITANVTVIVASLSVASAGLLAFGARNVATNIISGLMNRDYVKEGQEISILGHIGKVSEVKRTGIIVKGADKQEHFIPHALVQQYGSVK